MTKRLAVLALTLVLCLGTVLPASAAVKRLYIPYDTVELYTIDLYSPYTGSINLNDAIVNKTDYADITFYTDEACTQESEYLLTLTQDTKFWAVASAGSWKSKAEPFMVYVSGTGMTIEADYNEASGTITLTAVIERGTRRRIPTGEVTFTQDGTDLGTVSISTGGKAVCTFPAPAGTHSYTATFLGDENFGYASTSTRIEITQDGVMKADAATAAVKAHFEGFYRNPIAVAALSQSGPGSITTHHLIALDLSGFNTDDNFDGDGYEILYFYLYNADENTYQKVSGYIDEYNRVNVVTASGGYLIVSEGELEKR